MRTARVLAEIDKFQEIAAAIRFADYGVANHDKVTVACSCVDTIDCGNFAFIRIGNVVVQEFGIMAAGLKVGSERRVVNVIVFQDGRARPR